MPIPIFLIMGNECKHKRTFKRDDLFRFNPFFGVKKCELCGKDIVLTTKFKLYIVAYVLVLILILLFLFPKVLPLFLPNISYFAKGLFLLLPLMFIYGFGLYLIMQKAEYKEHKKVSHLDSLTVQAYQKSKEKAKNKIESKLKK